MHGLPAPRFAESDSGLGRILEMAYAFTVIVAREL